MAHTPHAFYPKKFTGDGCIGKRVFTPLQRTDKNAADMDRYVRRGTVGERERGNDVCGSPAYCHLLLQPHVALYRRAQAELRDLRRLWLEKLLSFERESARRICLKVIG